MAAMITVLSIDPDTNTVRFRVLSRDLTYEGAIDSTGFDYTNAANFASSLKAAISILSDRSVPLSQAA